MKLQLRPTPFASSASGATGFSSTLFAQSRRPCWSVRAQDTDSGDDEPPTLMDDWRQFRAKLVAEAAGSSAGAPGWPARQTPDNLSVFRGQHPTLAHEDLWAHATALPERGGLVVATPRVGKGGFWQAVIFLTQHGPEGSLGFMLNRPTSLTIGRLPLASDGAPSGICEAFPENRLYCGGYDGQQILSLMHGQKGVDESSEVVPGIYMASHGSVTMLRPTEVKFFSGCVAWGAGELEAQVQRGAWQPAACSRAVVLKNCLALPVPLWVEVLRLMGGEHAAVAEAEYPGQAEDDER